MREIVSIDKDFLSNKEVITTKQKPNSRAKGKVTVSLFDEKGNKQREIKTENIVFDWVKAYSFKNSYLKNFGMGSMGSYNTSSICTEGYAGVLPLSKYLMLFSGDHEDTDPKKSLIKDKLIGYAGRYENYSGSDILKGTYNAKESKTSIDEEGNIIFHMVYDFPTHSANGNITGIGLGHTYLRNKELLPSNVTYLNNTNSSSNTKGIIKYNTSISCSLDNDMFTGVFMPTITSNTDGACSVGVFDRTMKNIISNLSIPYSHRTYVYKPSSIDIANLTHYAYMGLNEESGNVLTSYNTASAIDIARANGSGIPPLTYDGLTIYVKKIDKNGIATTIKVPLNFDFKSLLDVKETITTIYSGSASLYLSSLLYEDKIVCYVRTHKVNASYICNNSNLYSYLFIFDLEGNCEKSVDVSQYSTIQTCKIIPYGIDEFLIPLGQGKILKSDLLLSDISVVDLSSLNIHNKDKINLDNFNSLSSYDFVGNYNRKSLFVLDNSNSYEARYKLKDDRINLSSYTRLPSPIVKSNTQTMKVQYDLVIEDVSVFDYIEY